MPPTVVMAPKASKISTKMHEFVEKVQKRDGAIVQFDLGRISKAIYKAMLAVEEGSEKEADLMASKVYADIMRIARRYKNFVPTVEGVQDTVEKELILSDYVKTAKAYILYRQERALLRERGVAVPERVRKLAEESKKYFRNPLAEFVYYRTYARWIDKEMRRETWVETVDRYMDFMREHVGDKLKETEYKEVREAILSHQAMPSMRLMQFAGPATRKTNVCAYNCSYIAPSKIQDFAEIMYISMCGTGVGFSVESKNIQKLPQIKPQSGKKLPIFMVPDSKEGWADALTFGMKTWYNGEDVNFDYSHLRPAGARLKVMGGKASGPDPLKDLLDFTRDKILRRQGKRLSNLDAHDIICKIGSCVVAGGVRRSAMISLSDLDDNEMRDAKKGQFYISEPQRSIANNSAVYEQKPSAEEFLDEWLALMKSRSGERGIFNRGSLAATLPERRIKVLKGNTEKLGTNPCVTADTWVMTKNGGQQVRDLIGKTFSAVVDGKIYSSAGFYKTGHKNVFEISTRRGFSFKATANHKVMVVEYKSRKIQRNIWKEVKDLTLSDRVVINDHQGVKWPGGGTKDEGWLLGNLFGDGNIEKTEKSQRANLDYWGEGKVDMMSYAKSLVHATVGGRSDLVGHVAKTGYARLGSVGLGSLAMQYGMTYSRKFPHINVEKTSSEFHEGFLRGWFDADGSVQGNHVKGVSIRLTSISREALYTAQRMLARLGIIGTVYENRRLEGERLMPDGYGGSKMYNCAATHELIIAGASMEVYNNRVGFSDSQKQSKLNQLLSVYKRKFNREKFYSQISKINLLGKEEVYDCTVGKVHAFDGNGVMLHNCAEILLQSKQFCNLTTVVARPDDTEKTLLNKVRVATILGTYQSTLTYFPYLSREWKKNCEQERLLGVSITGQWDSPAVRDEKVLEKLKKEALKVNAQYAKRFGVNASTCITCVKPEGTVSQTVDCASGMHPRHSPYYIRRVRISATDSLFKMLRDQGVPYHPEVGQSRDEANTYVLEFPVKAPEGAVYKDDLSALDQLEHWKKVKEAYTEHNPSQTVSIGDEEWISVANWLYNHWDYIGGLSFLPRTNHVYQLAPYEEIDKAAFDALAKRWAHVDFAKIVTYEQQDETDNKRELACAGGTCEI